MKKYTEISNTEIENCKELAVQYETSLAHVVDIYRRTEDFDRTSKTLSKESD